MLVSTKSDDWENNGNKKVLKWVMKELGLSENEVCRASINEKIGLKKYIEIVKPKLIISFGQKPLSVFNQSLLLSGARGNFFYEPSIETTVYAVYDMKCFSAYAFEGNRRKFKEDILNLKRKIYSIRGKNGKINYGNINADSSDNLVFSW